MSPSNFLFIYYHDEHRPGSPLLTGQPSNKNHELFAVPFKSSRIVRSNSLIEINFC